MLQALKALCLIQFWGWKNSLFPLLALWGNKNCPPSIKFGNFPTFSLSYWEVNSYCPRRPKWERGILPTPKLDETEDFQCLEYSNWTICMPLSHFCSENFPSFSLSYWEANSYYPRGLIMGKGKFLQLPNWMKQRGFSACGIQTGPLAAL